VWVGCARATVGRCNGVLTLTARNPGTKRPALRVVGSTRFRLEPGRMRRLDVHLFRPARRHFPKHRARRAVRLQGHAFVSVRDRQGLTRTRTAPLLMERPRR
jgi:hypothetical protein